MNHQRDTDLTLARLRAAVEGKLSKPLVDEVLEAVEDAHVKFWGAIQPPDFTELMVLLTIYHDITMIGYQRLHNRLHVGYPIGDGTIRHNAQNIRRVLFTWAQTKIIEGDQDSWTKASKDVPLPADYKGPCLWADSTDFALERKRGMGRKSDDWSYKLNHPGQRYMIVMDGRSFIRQVWGGYSPKVHDSQYISLTSTWWEEHLDNVAVIADEHFAALKHRLTHIKFFTPIRKPPVPKSVRPGARITVLSKKQEAHNTAQRRVRARVERPFSWIKETFSCLKFPFAEGKDQQDCLAWFAIGCWNVMNAKDNVLEP